MEPEEGGKRAKGYINEREETERADSEGTLMTEGSIWRKIIFFAVPILLGNLFQQLYNTVDSLIVGNWLGSNALAAVSSSGNLIQLMVGFFNGIALGAGVVISRYFGAGDKKNMSLAIHTTVAFGLVMSVVLTVMGVILAPLILVLMNTPPEVLPSSVSYFRVYFAGASGLIMYNIFVGILQAVGDSRHPLYFLIISSVTNVVLDLLFVAGFNMGVGSAAFATIISQFLSAFLCLRLLLGTSGSHRLYIGRIAINRDMLVKIVKFGIPSGVQNSIISLANVVVQTNINAFGEMAMAGCGAYAKIEGFAFLPITSFTMALTTFVGQNLGAGNTDRTKKGALFGMLCSMAIAEFIGVLIFVFAPALIAAFDSTPEVVAFGTARARTCALFFFLLAFSHSASAVLRGAGKAVVPMLVMMIFWCVVRVTLLTFLVSVYPTINMVYAIYPVTWFMSSAAFLIYYSREKRAVFTSKSSQ